MATMFKGLAFSSKKEMRDDASTSTLYLLDASRVKIVIAGILPTRPEEARKEPCGFPFISTPLFSHSSIIIAYT
jgi:hypothetical protein